MRRISTLRPLELAINVLPLMAALVMGYRQRWVAEDAFISLRVVDNLLAGHGPVFNIGERVEVYTHPLWVLMITVCGLVGIRPEYAAVALGLLLSGAGILLAQLGAFRLIAHLYSDTTSSGRITLPAGMLVFVTIPVVWDFLTSGMESGLTFAWLGASFWLLVRHAFMDATEESWRKNALTAAAVFGLGPLIRPDLGIFSVVFLLVLAAIALTGRSRRHQVIGAGTLGLFFVAAPGIYQLFRMGYFASLVPNTALAKEAGSANWVRGWEYLTDFVMTYHLWIPLILLACGLTTLVLDTWKLRWRVVLVVLAPVIAAVLHAGYIVSIGGDFMHARLLLPALFGLLLPLAVVSIEAPDTGRVRTAIGLSGLAILVVWAAASALTFRWSSNEPLVPGEPLKGITDERAFFVAQTGNAHPMTVDDYRGTGFDWVEHGLAMRLLATTYPRIVLTDYGNHPLGDHVQSEVALVVYARSIGVQSHAAGNNVRLVDLHGLGDPLASRMEITEAGRAGHEKTLPQVWIHARYANFEEISDPPADLQVAVETLHCGDVAALIKAVEEPMSLQRFASNIGLSWRLTSLRIHPDPVIARQNIC